MTPGSTPDLDALRVHEGLVRSVARAVLRGDDRVEDVVQETWIASGRAGPRDPAAAKGWLARVARRFALGFRRADASRTRREHDAFRDESAPSVLEIAEREETRRLVVEALLAVEEPFRSALVLRYYEGLPPRAIAARLGVPAETARSRVRRGLERLRERLVGDGDPRRRRRLAALATGPAAAALWIGGTAMTLKGIAATAAAVAAIGIGVWALARPSGERPAGTETATAPPPATTAPTLAAAPPSDAAKPAVAAAPAPTPPVGASARRVLVGRFLGVTTPVAGPVRLEVRGLGDDGEAPTEVVTGEATAEGTFSLNVTALLGGAVRAKELEVRVDAPEYMPEIARVEEPPAGKEIPTLLVVLRRAGALSGRLVTEDGTPIPGGIVGLVADASGRKEASVDAVRTGPDGTYRVRAAVEGTYLIAADADDLRPAGRREALALGRDRAVADLVLGRGLVISGTAVAPALGDLPLSVRADSADLERPLGLRDASGRIYRPLAWKGEELAKYYGQALVDSRGAWRMSGLAPAEYRLVLERRMVEDPERGSLWAHQDLTSSLARRVTAPAVGVVLTLDGGAVRIEVVGPAGPAAKASVSISGVGDGPNESTGMFWLSTDDRGTGRILLRPGAAYDLEARVDGFVRTKRRVRGPALGAEVVERIVLEPSAPPSRPPFVVTLEPGEGKSVDAEAPVFRLRREGVEDDVWQGRGKWEAGRFLLEGVPAGRGTLTVATAGVMAGGSLPWLEAAVPVDVPAGGGGSARMPMTMGGWLVLTALTPDGRRVDARCRVLNGRGERMGGYFMARLGGGDSAGGSGQLSAEAPARLEPPVPAGTYAIELSADGFADRRVEVVVKAGETTKVEATLSPP